MSENIKLESPIVLRRERPLSWPEIVSRETLIRILVVAGLLIGAYWSEIHRLVRDWYNKPDWTHGFLIPVISLYLVHLHRVRLSKIEVRPNLLGAGFVAAAAAMYVMFMIAPMGYMRAFSLLVMVFGLVMLLGGWRLAWAVWFPIALLVFALPLPDLMYQQATQPLRKIVTLLSTGTLNLLPGLQAEPNGMVINYVYQGTMGQLAVEEACSGMRLLMAFLAMAAVMAYLMREKPMWHRLTLLGLCVPIAMFCNFIRVTITSFLHVFGYKSLAQGGSHAALGLAMMVLALGLFWAVNWLLSAIMTDAPDDEAGEGTA